MEACTGPPTAAYRSKHPQYSLFYRDDPLLVLRASKQYLYDENQEAYLDCISNVQHVGHCHPAVIEAVASQMALTNTNNRFLHPAIVECAQKLQSTFPAELNTFYFGNSGSESNDLAYRIALEYTGGTETIVLDHDYHGHLCSTIQISPYKFNGPGGRGCPPNVHVAPCPDVYRGKHRLPDEDLNNPVKLAEMGRLYALEVRNIIAKIDADGKKLVAFFMEALESCGGQVITPPEFLKDVIKYVHEAGGVVVVDEVQSGFGRVGKCFWAHQLHDGFQVVPDIVTMGKPMGNGFPVSGLVTKKAIAKEFCRGGMEYFNTYGGNPVSCAACLAVFNVLEKENLVKNAEIVGLYALDCFRQLQKAHPRVIGDVRGAGLFLGIELVDDRITRAPAGKEFVKQILLRMKRRKILLSSEGPFGNIVKIKPPMCFTKDNVDQICRNLGEVLTELQQETGAVNSWSGGGAEPVQQSMDGASMQNGPV